MAVQDKKTLNLLSSMNVHMGYSFYPWFDNLKEGDIKKFNLEELLKTNKPFLGFSDIDTTSISRSSNPHFSALSNVSNYEYRSLFYHLYDTTKVKDTEFSKQIFTDYLKEKGAHYHKQMADFFELLNIDEVANACEADKRTISDKIKNAANHEKMLFNLLSNSNGKIPDNVLKTELAKMQIRWVVQEKGEAAQTQFEYLTAMIKHFSDKDTGGLKQYYDESLSFFDKLKTGIYQIPEGEKRAPLNSKYNLVERLFKKTAKAAQEPMQQTASKSSKGGKIAVAILGAAALFGSIFAYVKHRKNNLADNKPKENNLIEQPNNNNLTVSNNPPAQLNAVSMQNFINSTKYGF